MLDTLQNLFTILVQYAILLMEVIGVCILIVTAVKSAVGLFRHDSSVKLRLAEGIGLALEFKLGSEVLRTVIVRSWSELAILGAIVVLRAAITFLIQWEIKNEKQSLEMHKEQKQIV
ncbi:MAG: DUF1622 domain-containing protein [Clostridia bacterium]